MSDYTEKDRRIYYQDIVYKVCNLLDKHCGRKPGTGLVCGTIDEPSDEVQDELSTILNKHTALKRENERLKEYLAKFEPFKTWVEEDTLLKE